jgi:hypothetical protein
VIVHLGFERSFFSWSFKEQISSPTDPSERRMDLEIYDLHSTFRTLFIQLIGIAKCLLSSAFRIIKINGTGKEIVRQNKAG